MTWRVLFLSLLAMPVLAAAKCIDAPDGLALLGYSGEDGWQLYFREDASWHTRQTALEPRHFAYPRASGRLAYLGIDSRLYLSEPGSGDERQLAAPDREITYTHPVFTEKGDALYLVGMHERNSLDTDIYRLDLAGGKIEAAVRQRSTQFEPFPSGDWLYYSHVACVNSCGGIIQDIWRKNRVSGRAEQLTRGNSIARDPIFDPATSAVIYASNRSGHYNLWRQSLQGGAPQRLTESRSTDLAPRLAADGRLLFTRQTERGSSVHYLDRDFVSGCVSLPPGVERVRSLTL